MNCNPANHIRSFIIAAILLTGIIPFVFVEEAQAALTDMAKPAVQSADKDKADALREEAKANDQLGRTTPRGALAGFRQAANADDYKRAARYLDLREFSKEDADSKGPELAKQLNLVIDRELDLKLSNICDLPEGGLNDGLSPSEELIGAFDMGGKRYEIALRWIRDAADEKRFWVFSDATVWTIPQMYQVVDYGVLQKLLPKEILEKELFDFRLVMLLGILISILVGLAGGYVLRQIVFFLLKLFGITRVLNYLTYLKTPFFLLLAVFCARNIGQYFLFSQKARDAYSSGTVLFLFTAWFIVRSIDYFTQVLARRRESHPVLGKTVALNSFNRVLKYVVIAIILALWLHNIGFNLTTILTGLGIGGLAIALASQKSLEDLFGALTILSEKPFKIGDMIKFGDKQGEVLEIDLRYTFIQTLDRTVISIPNAQIAGIQIENCTKRDQFWYHPKLTLRYETTPAQISLVLEEVRSLLKNHPEVSESPPLRVNFVALADYSLDLQVSTYVKVQDYAAFLKVSEELNFSIMEIVSRAGAQFAFPSQTIYMDGGENANGRILTKEL